MRSRAVGPLWGLASLVALAGLGVCASEVSFAEDALGGLVQTGAEGASISSGQLKQLKLCDCHFQQSGDGDDGGKPEDLTCDTEGFFIAGFERAGVFSGYQNEGFPLSSAICCRPCFDPADPESATVGADVAAIISVACEQSSYHNNGLECPGDTFLMGFPESRVGQPIGKYFPVSQAQCCRPSLLYKNGTQRLLRRCDASVPGACGASTGGSMVSCDARDDPAAALALGRLAYGFGHVLKAPGFGVAGSDYIPQAPAECCGICLDPSEPVLSRPCEASNFCNGHGHCSPAGRCLCNAGWTGPDCLDRDTDAFLDSWVPTPVIIAGLIVAAVGMCLCGLRILYLQRIVHVTVSEMFRLRSARGRAAEEEPLLGSEDESEWSEDEEDDEEAPGDEEGGAAAGSRWGYSELPAGEAAGAVPAADGGQDVESGGAEGAPAAEGDAAESSGAAGAEGATADGDASRKDAEGAATAAAAAAPPPQPRRAREPAIRNECSVCMSARLQVVFLPCGHACTCRGCSRRLARCPICRAVITRRQKLYIQSAG